MRIQAKHLSNHLKNTLAPVYLLFGEDPLQRMETFDAIYAKAKENGYEERLIFDLKTSESEWEHVKNEINSLSLFSQRRLFDCRLADGKFGKKGSEALLSLLNQLSSNQIKDTLFIFSLNDKPDASVRKSSWFTALERVGLSIVADTPKGKDFSDWLRARFLNAGLEAEPELIDCLQARTEGNLLAAAQAIEKLQLYWINLNKAENLNKPQKHKLILETTLKMIDVDARFSLYDLADAALSGSIQRTLQIFNSLKNEGVESILVLWVLTREVRTIIPLAKLAKEGKILPNTLREQGVWQHRIGLISSFLKRCPLSNLYNFLSQAASIDSHIKSNRQNDAWQALLSLSLDIAGVNHV